MANWSNPTLTSLYTDFVTEVKNRDVDLALGLDPATTSPTNVPTNAIRWNSANSRWEKYTSGSWGTLTATYALTSLSLTGSITFEGATDDAFETTLTVADPTADRTITLPNVSGTVVTTGDTGSITSTMIADGAVVNADISASAAIAHSKLANITAGQVLLGNASNIPTATALTGDVTIDSSGVTAIGSGVIVNADINDSAAIADTKLATISTAGKVDGAALTGTIPSTVLGNSNTFIGTTSIALNRASANQGLTGISSIALPGATSGTITVTPAATAGTTAITIPATSGTLVTTGDSGTVTSAMIADGTIANADVNASAAIAGTKISPDFGSQNVTTTGTSTAAGFIPSSATVPSNGLYLPAANQLGFSTASTSRLVVDASGNVNIDSGTFYVDAVNNRVGIGTTSPGSPLAVESNAGNQVKVTYPSIASYYLNVTSAGALDINKDGTSRLFVDASGNLGLGVVPSAWSGFGTSLEICGVGNFVGANASTLYVGNNTYYNAGFKYAASSRAASYYYQYNGEHVWVNAPSGTAGNAISFTQAMTLDASGRLGIGTTSPAYSLDVRPTGLGLARVGSQDNQAGLYISSGNASSPFLNFLTSTSTLRATIYAGASSDDLIFGTGSSGSERARIDSSGRLLVGTSSTSDSAKFLMQGNAVDSGGGAIINLCNGKATPVNGEATGIIRFSDNTHAEAATIMVARDGGTWSASSKPTRLVFSTTADGAASPTERMRIGNGGATGLYCDDTNDTLYASSAAAAGTTRYLFIGKYSATSPITTGTNSILIFTNGNIQNTNNSYGAISDIKLKENIVDATSQWSDIKSLQVRKYNFKEGQTHTQIGLIAQEVELISPGLVTESPDRDTEGNDLGTVTKSVNYSVLYMKAVKALQEAMERIETLETKVAALESR